MTSTVTSPLHAGSGGIISNECRMLMNVARYYEVISKIVTILDNLVISQSSVNQLVVMHQPENKSIVIHYGKLEEVGDEIIDPKVDARLVTDHEIQRRCDTPEIMEDLTEDVIIEEHVEEDFIYFEEEQLPLEGKSEDDDDIGLEVYDLVKDEEAHMSEFEYDEPILDDEQQEEESQILEYYVEYLHDAEETSEQNSTETECIEDMEMAESRSKPNSSILIRYKCQFLACNEKFTFAKDYDEHLRRSHSGIISKPIQLQCKHIDCNLTFDDTYKLQIHHHTHKIQQSINKNVPLSCAVCQKNFATRIALKRHTKEHAQESALKMVKGNFKRKCQFCSEILDPKINVYNIHCLEKHGHALYSCFMCGKNFFLLAHVNEHAKAEHSVESLQSFIEKSLWRSFTIEDITVKECRMCLRLFASSKAELQHQESHMKELSLTCAVCGGKHYESQCSEPRPKFTSVYEKVQCDQCHRWMSKKNIKDHRATHKNERNYPCTVCKKTFKVARTAHRHIQNHINAQNKLRKCYDCDQEYTDEEFLVKHYKEAHPDKRPYSCLICGEQFYNKALLGDHSHRHSDEDRRRISVKNPVEHYQIRNARVYECTLCRRSFSAKRTTVAHFIVHTDRPFVCEHCRMSFRIKTALEDHLLDEHKIKV